MLGNLAFRTFQSSSVQCQNFGMVNGFAIRSLYHLRVAPDVIKQHLKLDVLKFTTSYWTIQFQKCFLEGIRAAA
jgi:hypothetical protein